MDCQSCGNVTNKICTGCNLLSYCSIKCQKRDWTGGHSIQCRAIGLPFQELRKTGQLLPLLEHLTDHHLWNYLVLEGREDDEEPFNWYNMKEEMKLVLSHHDYHHFWWTRCQSSNVSWTPSQETVVNFFRTWIFFNLGNRILHQFIAGVGVHFDIPTALTISVVLDWPQGNGQGVRLLVPILQKLGKQLGVDENTILQGIEYLRKRNPTRPDIQVDMRGGAHVHDFVAESILSIKYEDRATIPHDPIPGNTIQELMRIDNLGLLDQRFTQYAANIVPVAAVTPAARNLVEYIAALSVMQLTLRYEDSSMRFFGNSGNVEYPPGANHAFKAAVEMYSEGLQAV
jgi:hypothetical protein